MFSLLSRRPSSCNPIAPKESGPIRLELSQLDQVCAGDKLVYRDGKERQIDGISKREPSNLGYWFLPCPEGRQIKVCQGRLDLTQDTGRYSHFERSEDRFQDFGSKVHTLSIERPSDLSELGGQVIDSGSGTRRFILSTTSLGNYEIRAECIRSPQYGGAVKLETLEIKAQTLRNLKVCEAGSQVRVYGGGAQAREIVNSPNDRQLTNASFGDVLIMKDGHTLELINLPDSRCNRAALLKPYGGISASLMGVSRIVNVDEALKMYPNPVALVKF